MSIVNTSSGLTQFLTLTCFAVVIYNIRFMLIHLFVHVYILVCSEMNAVDIVSHFISPLLVVLYMYKVICICIGYTCIVYVCIPAA